jgi:transcriptional regulator with XRE-family HTH domain
MMDMNKQLGKRIKQIRKAAKLTQESLAEKAGLSVEYISRLERGLSQPSFKTLEALAKSLNVNAKDFFDFKGTVVFRDKKQEARQKKEYIDAISSELPEMEVRELTVVYNVLKGLTGKAAK